MEMDGPLRIEAEGVTVAKRYEPEEFAVPTIAFEIRSTRRTPATIRLEERIPDSFSPSAIGFHPEYDDERWTNGDDGLVFESRIEPDTTVITIYGIRITDDVDAAAFMNRPELTVDPVEPADRPAFGTAEADDRLAGVLIQELSALRREVAAIDARIEAAIDRQDEAIDALEASGREPTNEDLVADIEAVSDDLDALYDEVGEIQARRKQAGVGFDTE